jgi:hypothetical protein
VILVTFRRKLQRDCLAHKRNRLSLNAKFSVTERSSKRAVSVAAQGPLCPMRYERSTPRPPVCPSCTQTMRLARITSRFGELPDVYAFECRACGVSHIEAGLEEHCINDLGYVSF